MDREAGKDILIVEGISKTIDGVKVLDNVSFRVNKGDKIAFVGQDEVAPTTMFKILMGELEPDAGSYKWGVTITSSYFPMDNSSISTAAPKFGGLAQSVYFRDHGVLL